MSELKRGVLLPWLVGLTTFGLACGPATPEEAGDTTDSGSVTIEYLAHASFIVTGPEGERILIDPYQSRVWLGYDFPEGVTADAVLVTHPHYDHDAGVFRGAESPWPDTPTFREPGVHAVGSTRVVGVEGKHADPYGKEFGQLNTIFVLETAGIRIAHLGDNGPLTPENVREIGPVDVLMIAGDALYHIVSPEATDAAIEALQPSIVIPMHYRIPELELDADSPSDLGEVGPWLEGRGPVEMVGRETVVLTADDIDGARRILVLEHSPRIPPTS